METKTQVQKTIELMKTDPAFKQAVEMVKPVVQKIESGPPLTKDNYGAYMTALAQTDDKKMRNLLALAMIAAGANASGVACALKLI
jgi:hypothetical protein